MKSVETTIHRDMSGRISRCDMANGNRQIQIVLNESRIYGYIMPADVVRPFEFLSLGHALKWLDEAPKPKRQARRR